MGFNLSLIKLLSVCSFLVGWISAMGVQIDVKIARQNEPVSSDDEVYVF